MSADPPIWSTSLAVPLGWGGLLRAYRNKIILLTKYQEFFRVRHGGKVCYRDVAYTVPERDAVGVVWLEVRLCGGISHRFFGVVR